MVALTPPGPIVGWPHTKPLDNVTPFTYRDGFTYASKLEAMQSYLCLTLVPEIDKILTDQNEHFDEEILLLVNTVNSALAANQAWTEAEIGELQTYVDNTVASIINDSVDANDPVVTALINNLSSTTRTALDATYQAKGTVSDTAVAALLASATATRIAMDARYMEDGTASDGATAGLVNNAASATRAALDALYLVATSAAQQSAVDGRVLALINDAAASTNKVYSSSKTVALIKDKTLRGTYAARPAPGTVPDGTVYICTDIPEQYITVAGAWSVFGSGGNELGYAQITTTISTSSTSPSAIAGLTIPFKAGERPIMVEIFAKMRNSVQDTITSVRVLLDGVQIMEIAHDAMFAAGYVTMMSRARKSGLVPGSDHTITVQWVVGGGTADIEGSTTCPAFVSVATA